MLGECRAVPGLHRTRRRHITMTNGASLCTMIGMLLSFSSLEARAGGVSWITILKKRGNYRKAFDRFPRGKDRRYGAREVKRLLGDAGIVRNR